MTHNWPMVPLGEILTRSDEMTAIELIKTYRRVTVKMWGQGAVLRDEIEGDQVAAKKQSVVHANQFILSRIDARHGATAIVPESLNGAVVSNDFPSFNLDQSSILPQYLGWLSKTHNFVELCRVASEGTTNRVRLKLNRFLEMRIPLPPLDEQCRIVARIEELTAKVEQAQSLRDTIHKQLDGLLFSLIEGIIKDAKLLSMKDIAPLVRRPVEVMPLEDYYQIGIYSFGRGVFHKPPVDGFSLGNKRIYKIKTGDLLFNNVFAWEGAIAIARQRDDGRVGSHRFITCVPDTDVALAPFLCYYFLSRDGLEKISLASPGSAGRNRTLNIKSLMSIKVPIPSLEKQREFCSVQAKVDAVRRHQTTTAAKLDALLLSILDKAFKGAL